MAETEIKLAARLIADLLSASHDCALVPIQDGGLEVDVVYSRVRGRDNEAMDIPEAEIRIDSAIRSAWRALTGKNIPAGADPFEYITRLAEK